MIGVSARIPRLVLYVLAFSTLIQISRSEPDRFIPDKIPSEIPDGLSESKWDREDLPKKPGANAPKRRKQIIPKGKQPEKFRTWDRVLYRNDIENYDLYGILPNYSSGKTDPDSPEYASGYDSRVGVPSKHVPVAAEDTNRDDPMICEFDRNDPRMKISNFLYVYGNNTYVDYTKDIENKVLIVLNSATEDGFSKWVFKEVMDLYDKYADWGLQFFIFPSNQFGEQEPYNDDEIPTVLTERGWLPDPIPFPVLKKGPVTGAGQHPIFHYLTTRCMGEDQNTGLNLLWNYEKFLIDRKGLPHYRLRAPNSLYLVEWKIRELLGIPDEELDELDNDSSPTDDHEKVEL